MFLFLATRYGSPVDRPPKQPESASISRRTRFATVTLPTCSKLGPTCEPFRFYWGTPDWSTPSCTSTSPPNISRPSAIRWMRSNSPASTRSSVPGGWRKNDPATLGGGRYRSRTRESLHREQSPLDSLDAPQGPARYRSVPHCHPGRPPRPVFSLRLSCHFL